MKSTLPISIILLFVCCFVHAQQNVDSIVAQWEKSGVPAKHKKDYEEWIATKEQRESWKNYLKTLQPAPEQAAAIDTCKNTGFEGGNFGYWYRFTGTVDAGTNCPDPYYTMGGYTPPGNANMAYNALPTASDMYSIHSQIPTSNTSNYGNDMWCHFGGVYALPQIHSQGGSFSARINNSTANAKAGRAEYMYTVPAEHPYFVYDWAAVMGDGGHQTGEQAAIRIRAKDMQGNLLNIPNAEVVQDVNHAQSSSDWKLSTWSQQGEPIYFHGWERDTIQLCPYVGQTIRLSFEALDCAFGGHFCYMYLDASCNYSLANATAITQNFVCPDSLLFKLTAPAGYMSYQWIDPNGTNITPSQTGTQQVLDLNAYINNCPAANCSVDDGDVFTVLLYTALGCSLTSKVTIKIDEVLLSNSSVSPTCKEANHGVITVGASGGMGAGTYQYQWYANSCTGTPIDYNSTLDSLYSGVYCVTILSGSCPPVTKTFTVPITPITAEHLSESFPPCLDSSMFIAVPGNQSSFIWYKNDTVITAAADDSLLIYSVDHPDRYAATFLDSAGCKDSLVFHTSIQEGSEKNFEAVFCPNDSIARVYLPLSYNAQNIQWFVNGNGVADSLGGKNDTLLFDVYSGELGTYHVTWDENGCKKRGILYTQIFPDEVFIPDTTVSIFTPNNDSVNDVFYPYAEKQYSYKEIIKETSRYRLYVFNRWGNLIFESDNYVSGWNGKNFLGEPAPEGTYFWIAEFESNCMNKDALTRKKGFVNLARGN